MSPLSLAVGLAIVAAVVGAIEHLLAHSWSPRFWAGPAVRFRRRLAAPPDVPSLVASIGASPSDDAVFAGFAAREIRPGIVAVRERDGQRRPHLGYFPALRAHLRRDPGGLTLAVAPAWSTLALVAAGGVGLFSGQVARFVAVVVLLMVAVGGVVQAFRFRRLFRRVAPAPERSGGV